LIVARMTKQELREDPVLERIQGGLDYMERNARWLTLGVVAVVIVIVATMMIQRGRQRAEVEASQQLTMAQGLYLQGQHARAAAELQELLSRHGGTSAADQARIYLGDALLAQGQAVEALAAFDDAAAGADDQQSRAAAERGRAAALETLGRLAEASQAYEHAAQAATHFQSDDLLGAGRCALQAGDPARAQTLLARAKELAGTAGEAKISFYLAQAEAALEP
jgi:tetratricopeptide (TPR) repeat protein